MPRGTVKSNGYEDWTDDLIDEVANKFLQPIALSAAHHINDEVFGINDGIKPHILGTFKHRYSETVICAIKQCLSTNIPFPATSLSSSSSVPPSSSASSVMIEPSSYFIANIDSEEPST